MGSTNIHDMKMYLGNDVSDEDCIILIEEYGNKGNVIQLIFDAMETSQVSAPELAAQLRSNYSVPTKKLQLSGDAGAFKTQNEAVPDIDSSWSIARSKSTNNIYKGTSQRLLGDPQRSASATAHLDNPSAQPMPYSGTGTPLTVLRNPKGMDASKIRSLLSGYLQDSAMRNTLYDIHENRGSGILIIMRGASGSGKSTLASVIWSINAEAEICSADHYFINRNGQYNFDPTALGKAHESCRNRCRSSMSRGDTPIIIDNTNTRIDEMIPYVDLAIEHNYDVRILEPNTAWKNKPGRLAEKNQHGVPKRKIEDQLNRFEAITAKNLVNMVLKNHKNKNNYRINENLDWGKPAPPSSNYYHPPVDIWSMPSQQSTQLPLQPLLVPTPEFNALTLSQPGRARAAAVPSPAASSNVNNFTPLVFPDLSTQISAATWTKPPPVSPTSPTKLSEFVPDLLNGNNAKPKRGAKKNGNSPPQSTTTPPVPKPLEFEDPAHATFKQLQNFFPFMAKEDLEEVFNKHDGELNQCVIVLIEAGHVMVDVNEQKAASPIAKDGTEGAQSEDNWNMECETWQQDVAVSTTSKSKSSDSGTEDIAEMLESNGRSDAGAERLPTQITSTYPTFDDLLQQDVDMKSDQNDEESGFEMSLPPEFAQVLLRAYGHPEDEGRQLNPDMLKIKLSDDIAFQLFTGLYQNLHQAETEQARARGIETPRESPSDSSTRSCSPEGATALDISAGVVPRDVFDEFDEIAASLCQMDMETKAKDPDLNRIMEIESKIQQQTTAALRPYTSPYRSMAQNINFCLLKQDFPHLDPSDVNDVYTQCLLNVELTKKALNEMYPAAVGGQALSSKYVVDASSSGAEGWTLKYNPKDVAVYSTEQIKEMEYECAKLEKDMRLKVSRIKDYRDNCLRTTDPQTRAHYLREAQKLQDQIKKIGDEIQYYKAVTLNATVKYKNDNNLDLHGLTLSGAMRILKEFLQCKEEEFASLGTDKMILLIITGQGKHSRNGYAVLLPAVRNYLLQKKYRFHPGKGNPGSFNVILTRETLRR